ncbi:MAG: DUF1549 domain-containing protein, partial [Verrucomicrobiota bacterium]
MRLSPADRLVPLTLFSALISLHATAARASLSPEGIEFFETHIRPVLANECIECHSSHGKAKSGLVLDYRDGLLEGGDIGPAVVPGKPDESVIMEALRHEYDLTMPKAGVKLDPAIIARFEEWITMGAPDPRDEPPSPDAFDPDALWSEAFDRRRQWWSFQPIKADLKSQSIDAFLNEAIAKSGLETSPPTDPARLVRRLHFILTGLPPKPDEVATFIAAARENRETAVADRVDELLDSKAFGERWARHWMDWFRYAESHGSEGDPRIQGAHHYRDYLIRSLNQDIPYDRLLREHIAGDLLTDPRIDPETGFNESALGTIQWRMVFHGFAPVDALDERVKFTDDQINVFTKAFQSLTVSCARCHNHKFD